MDLEIFKADIIVKLFKLKYTTTGRQIVLQYERNLLYN